MSISKNAKISIAVIAALALIVAAVLYFTQGDKVNIVQENDNTPEPVISTPGVNTPVIVASYDVSGTWYSDRENGDILVLETFGTYTSSNWIAAGSYVVGADNHTITLTDSFGERKELNLTTNGSAYVMRYEGAAAHSYYRTMQEVTTARETQKAAAEEMQSFYDAALLQILTTGEWSSIDETTTLNFTNNTFIIDYVGNQFVEAATCEYSYVVTKIEVHNGHYSLKLDIYNKTLGVESKNSDVGIKVGDDNTYTITCGNFAFAQKYQKSIDIIFTQGSTGAHIDSHDTDSNTVGANSSGDTGQENVVGREVVSEDGTIERITQISRDDNPDDREHRAVIAELVEQEIYGTWKGTYEEMPKENTAYWVFTFSSNGTYSFTNGDGLESGSFTLTHNNDKYHSTLHLVPSAGEAKERRFYLSGSTTISMTIEGDTHPTYFRQ